jgi:site-specific recombinase XerD
VYWTYGEMSVRTTSRTWVDEYQFSRTSRRNYLRSVKRCLKWAVKQGYLDKNPVADLEVPAGEHKEVVISPPSSTG